MVGPFSAVGATAPDTDTPRQQRAPHHKSPSLPAKNMICNPLIHFAWLSTQLNLVHASPRIDPPPFVDRSQQTTLPEGGRCLQATQIPS